MISYHRKSCGSRHFDHQTFAAGAAAFLDLLPGEDRRQLLDGGGLRDAGGQLLNGPDPVKATKNANVVVTNPTRLAVGIRYKAEEAPLPRIVALGAGKIAKVIRETALEEGIPVMEDVPLARALYAKGRIEDFVPEDLLEPVAEILKWAKRLEDARKEEEELDSVQL